MSDEVSVDRLRKQLSGRGGFAFLITVGPDGRPHSVSVDVGWLDDQLVMAPGNGTVANARERPLVSLLWPARSSKGYSLMVNGTVTSASGTGLGDNQVVVAQTRAVLHRSIEPSTSSSRDRSCAPVYAPPGPEPESASGATG